MKKIWKNRQSENPNRRRLTATDEANVYDVARVEGLVLEEGDAFDQVSMNDLEERIATGFNEADARALTPTEKTKVLGGSNAWVATNVTMEASNTGYNLTVPNFVFTEGCSVTFKAPLAPIETPWLFVRVAGVMYALRIPQGQIIKLNAWVANATVTVTLSAQKFNLGNTGDERSGTAFYSGQQIPLHWIPSAVVLNDETVYKVYHYQLTIPGFVFVNGCTVTVTLPAAPKNQPRFLFINTGSGDKDYYAIKNISNGEQNTADFTSVNNAPITFALSDVGFSGNYRTAFVNVNPKIYIAPAGTTSALAYPSNSIVLVKR